MKNKSPEQTRYFYRVGEPRLLGTNLYWVIERLDIVAFSFDNTRGEVLSWPRRLKEPLYNYYSGSARANLVVHPSQDLTRLVKIGRGYFTTFDVEPVFDKNGARLVTRDDIEASVEKLNLDEPMWNIESFVPLYPEQFWKDLNYVE